MEGVEPRTRARMILQRHRRPGSLARVESLRSSFRWRCGSFCHVWTTCARIKEGLLPPVCLATRPKCWEPLLYQKRPRIAEGYLAVRVRERHLPEPPLRGK